MMENPSRPITFVVTGDVHLTETRGADGQPAN
jgi:hypothetical protein